MIINFNFGLSKVEFIWQQNKNKYFAVNFLMEYSQTKNFEAIIDEVLSSNDEILNILKKEKNYVIVPDEVIGFGSLQVPASKRSGNKYFKIRFDLVYNKHNNLTYTNDLYSVENGISTYTFACAKKHVFEDIISAFGKFSVKIFGISYYSQVLSNYVLKYRADVSKHNFIIMEKETNLKIYGVAKGKVIGYKTVNLDKNYENYAKKYVKFTKNNLNGNGFSKIDVDKRIDRLKADASDLNDIDKVQFAFLDFKNYFKTSSLKLGFQKIVLLNPSAEMDLDNSIINLDYDRVKILTCFKSSDIYTPKKRGILWQ